MCLISIDNNLSFDLNVLIKTNRPARVGSMITPILRMWIIFLGFCLPVIVLASPLKNHPSPYLSMHADDPVQWQQWGKPALDKARAENKLIFLSIGYFSCHWCHVMQRESYQDKEIGAFLNKYFVPVKVDRELRPVLDRRMIQFVETVRGQAGWPLNVFVTAEGYPVTGFTYLPRDSFSNVLQQLNAQWLDQHDEIKRVARLYFEQSEYDESQSVEVSIGQQQYAKLVDGFVSQAMLLADELQGGFGDTSKFPSYPQLAAMMKVVQTEKDLDPDVVSFITLTLDTMASRHLLDHVNGGFFRYTTDPDWHTPHFEKMLYDNAQLSLLYLDAEEIWPDRGYREIGLSGLEFILDFLRDEKGGYNSSLSAVDERNVEGGAYWWSQVELNAILSQEELRYLLQQGAVDTQAKGLFLLKPMHSVAIKSSSDEMAERIRQKLRQAEKSEMPVDDKKIASWNALVLQVLLKAQQYSSDQRYQQLAKQQFEYITTRFIQPAKTSTGLSVKRFTAQAELAETTLEDYAQLARALQMYAQINNSERAEKLSVSLVKQAFNVFYIDGSWIQDPAGLVPGDKGDAVIQDNVLESPLTVLLRTALQLPVLDEPLKEVVNKMALRLTKEVLEVPYHYGSSIMLANAYIRNQGNSDKLEPK